MDILNNIENINISLLKEHFKNNKKIKIQNFLNNDFIEKIYTHVMFDKNWMLATGIDKNKYEKKDSQEFDKINSLQIKNVNNAFGNDSFSYIFYRTMNAKNMTIHEFKLRKLFTSPEFLEIINNITELNITDVTTLFLSKYKTGNFLSPHSDKGNGKLAFVINMTKFWKPQYGGILNFLNDERNEIIESFVPDFNSLLLFYVPDNGIPHFVSHVSPNVKFNRFAITGWFK